jgi:hypothetical protein
MYKLYKDVITNTVIGVQKEQNGYLISIPIAEDNTDYQEYLKWVDAGNTPEPADE